MAIGYYPATYQSTYPGVTVSVANVWSTWSSNYTYGQDGNGNMELPIANTAGNWLFAVVQWQTTEDNAVVYAADDVHNFWQQLVITTSSTSAVRTAILCVQNARAAGQVTFSSSAFIRDAIYTVIEVSGLGQGLVIDAIIDGKATASSLSLSKAITTADFVLSAAVQQTITGSLSPSGGWTTVAGTQNTTSATIGRCAYQTTSTSPAAVTWTGAVSAPIAGVMVAVAAGASAPVNANPGWPVIQCQAAFGFNPGSSSSWPTWTDISSRYLGFKGQRGRTFELDQLEPADMTISLDNNDGALNPLNQSSPYWPNVTLMTPIRLLATWSGRTYCLFTGHIQYNPQTWDFQYGTVDAEVSDSFSKLPQVLAHSCLQQEVLYDKPWAYWTLADAAGSRAASNASGRSQEFLGEVSCKFGSAAYSFGNTASPALAGDSGTVWLTSGTVTYSQGNTLQLNSLDIPTIDGGMTIECWANLPSTQGSATPLPIIAVEGSGLLQSTGQIVAIEARAPGLGQPSLDWWDSSFTNHGAFFGSSILDGHWHHHALSFNLTSYSYYLDGVLTSSGSWTLCSDAPTMIEIGGKDGPYFNGYGWFTCGQFAHAAVYDRVIDHERIYSHYQAGVNGFAAETTGARISRFLTYAKWASPQAIDVGNTLMQELNYLGNGYASAALGGSAGTFGAYGNLSSQGSHMDMAIADVAASENGLLFTAADGTLVFRQRSAVYNGPTRASFGDTPGLVPYQGDIEFGYDVTYLYNDVTITRNLDQTTARAVAAASVNQYFPRVYTRIVYTQPASSAVDVIDPSNWLMNVYSQPSLRVAKMVVDCASNPAAWGTVLALDIGDTVSVTRNPPGVTPITETFIIDMIEPELGPDMASFTFTLAPQIAPVLTLGDATYGRIGYNVLGW